MKKVIIMKRRKIKEFFKRYEVFMRSHTLFMTVILSLVIAFITKIDGKHIELSRIIFQIFPRTFLNILPILLISRKKFFNHMNKNPIEAALLILYFLLFIPALLDTNIDAKGFYAGNRINIGIAILNTIVIVIGHVVLFKSVFLDIILKRRKSSGLDTLVVFLTYISLGVSFGLVYTIINVTSTTQAFHNLHISMIGDLGATKFYFRHIYYSFITLTSVGFGDIYPLIWPAQLFTVIEAVLGVFLLSFSLGIILNSEGSESIEKKESQEFKREILEEIKEMLEEQKKL